MSADETTPPAEPTPPDDSQAPAPRRRRRRGRAGGGPAGPATPTPTPSSPESEPAEEERPDEEALAEARLVESRAGEEEYAEATAFQRFSGLLGIAAIALLAGALVLLQAEGTLTRNVAVLLIVAAVLGVLYLIPRWGNLVDALRTRSARQGGNVTLASVAVVGLLVLGNWFANRHSPQWDLTASQRYTLSDQSAKVLGGLQQDVKVTAFFPGGQEDSFVRGTKDLLRQYDRRSDRVSVEFIDPELNPGQARQFEIQSYPVTIFQAGDRREETTGVTEQDFTSALLKLTRTERKKVYFVQGHQERDPDNAQEQGINAAAEALKRENYEVDKVSLLATPKVPDDAAVLVIAGPRAPFLDPERQAVQEYLDRGGKVFLLLDPRQDPGLGEVISSWGVQVGEDQVIDPGRAYVGDPRAILPLPQNGHRITATLPDLILPEARSVTIKPGTGSEIVIAPLLTSSDRAWAETNFSGAAARPDPEDRQGPVSVAVAANKAEAPPAFSPGAGGLPQAQPTPAPSSTPKGRLVVVGDSDFASNTYLNQVIGSRDFFVNSVNWLAEDEDLISVRATPAVAPPILLTSQAQVLVFYTSVVFVPLAVLLLGGVIWWQRR
jgi:ABC-type uncharacterized transport system involved in gliding motility auxiliary subunit